MYFIFHFKIIENEIVSQIYGSMSQVLVSNFKKYLGKSVSEHISETNLLYSMSSRIIVL